ncbi:MAG: response regulator [Bacteroidales bacterium]|jgi:CheY-like chemotaxis protein|nr:response regulator [Bacteroidales bacterium]
MHESILKGKKILIVEDDLSSRLYLNKILEKTEAILLNAGDGREAVEFVENDPGIDMVLMDIQLPVMDGYTSARKIRELRREVKLIAQTAYSFTGDMENMYESGFDDFLIKPIYSKQLIEKLSSWFNRDPDI